MKEAHRHRPHNKHKHGNRLIENCFWKHLKSKLKKWVASVCTHRTMPITTTTKTRTTTRTHPVKERRRKNIILHI